MYHINSNIADTMIILCTCIREFLMHASIEHDKNYMKKLHDYVIDGAVVQFGSALETLAFVLHSAIPSWFRT